MKRSFFIGEEWLYYKLYCGERTANRLLVEVIKPLTQLLESKRMINQWFFIRYSDPHFHLRLRFKMRKLSSLSKVISLVKEAFSPCFDKGLLWKVQTDTYQRELERYGQTSIEETEALFYIDSKACVAALSLIDNDKLLFFFTLRSIDQLMTVFNFSLDEKIAFSQQNLAGLKQEFRSNKKTNKQLLKKYKQLEKEGAAFLIVKEHQHYTPLLQLLNQKEKALKAVIHKIHQKEHANHRAVSLSDYFDSHVHMMVNRYFQSNQRLFELVCFHFLSTYYCKLKFKKCLPKTT